MGEVKAFAIHPRPHVDEVCAIWLFRRFGLADYPGSDTADIIIWSTGGDTPDGRSADEWEREGVIALGVGRGKYDEHPENDTGVGYDPDECTSMLVAKDLGVAGDPGLADILGFVNENDLRGRSVPFDLATLIRDVNNEHPDEPERVIEWGSAALDVKYEATTRALAGKAAADAGIGVDEVCGVWLLRKFGAQKWPELAGAPIKLIGPDEDSGDWSSRGYFVVHVGGGECSCDIAAKELGMSDEPSLSQILHYVRTHNKERSGPLELPSVIASFGAVYPEEPERAFQWCAIAFDVKHVVQQLFHAAKKDFDAAIKEEAYIGTHQVTIVTVESDNPTVARYARSKHHGCNAAVVIQKNSKGQVQIYATKRHGVHLDDLAKMLRVLEQKAKGAFCTSDFRELGSHGRVTGAEEWWYHKEGEMLLNGSLSAPDVPPTKLDLETIRNCVKLGINPQGLPKECADANRCVFGRKCQLYAFGLYRCYKLRREERGRSR